jgi:HEAT repeat protein
MIKGKKQKQTKSKSLSESRGQNNKEAATSLVADFASHNDTKRVKARHSLVAMGKATVPLLTEALKSQNSLVRWEAAKALGEIGDPGTASALVDALEDEDFDVRWLAAEGLTKLNVLALKPSLQALEKRGDSILLQEGAHHVFHDLAKGGLRKFLAPVLAALEALEPGVEVPWAARQALDMLEKAKKL